MIKNSLKIKTTVTVPIRRVQDMLCCAFEGGSNYWYMIEKFHEPEYYDNFFDAPLSGNETSTDKIQVYRHVDYPTNPGGYLIVSDAKEASGDDVRRVKLDLETCTLGLQTMAEKYPRHFSDMMSGNDDATTGDVFLQCCLFGDLIYG